MSTWDSNDWLLDMDYLEIAHVPRTVRHAAFDLSNVFSEERQLKTLAELVAAHDEEMASGFVQLEESEAASYVLSAPGTLPLMGLVASSGADATTVSWTDGGECLFAQYVGGVSTRSFDASFEEVQLLDPREVSIIHGVPPRTAVLRLFSAVTNFVVRPDERRPSWVLS